MDHPKSNSASSANRLLKEKSPYLLQHAYNPVDWFPWGEEAFEKARRENKPILLSIGYSTCHWCHVMEHESFEDPEIARLMNETVVAIKVDREERPDIDQIYMSAVTAMTGQGGWPLNVFLTPDKKPFYGGTYFPPEARWGSPGFPSILTSIHQAWQDRKDEILKSGDSLTEVLRLQGRQERSSILDEKILNNAYNQFAHSFDAKNGGFGQQPKFPSSHNLSFLLRYWLRTKEAHALTMVENTLTAMSRGGMYDHLGGGFHRYSTDAEWQVPHFEKMLYDQAILARTYCEAYQVTHKILYAQVAREIFDYVLRDMRHPDGGFYSAEDADSFDPEEFQKNPDGQLEKTEGAFYLFRASEILHILGDQDAAVFNAHFGIEPDGNARFDPHGEFVGKNIIFLSSTVEDTAARCGRTAVDVEKVIQSAKEKLFEARAKRPRPHLDDKILVDWNGLMISALALGGRVLGEPKYIRAAAEAAEFILTHLKKEDRLLHRFRDGEAAINATLADYAFLSTGLLDLYEATFEVRYLREALGTIRLMTELFKDPNLGGFFTTASDHEELILRPKELYDGAIPSGNSMAALVLLKLGEMTFDPAWINEAEAILKSFSGEISEHSSAYAQMLIALDFWLGPRSEFVIAAGSNHQSAELLIQKIYARFIPNKVVVFRPADEQKEGILSINPAIKDYSPAAGKTSVYLCHRFACHTPVTEPAELEQLLEKLQKNPS